MGQVVRLDAAPEPPAPVPVTGPPPGWRQRWRLVPPPLARVRDLAAAATAAQLTALACGAVGSDYVGSAYFGLIVPALTGIACAWVVGRAAAAAPRVLRLGVAGLYAILGAVFAFVFLGTPFGPPGQWVPPLLCSLGGVLAWPLLDPAPPG